MIFIDDIGEEAFSIIEEYPFVHGLTTNSSILKKRKFSLSRTLELLSNIKGKHFVQVSLKNTSWIDILSEVDRNKFVVKVVWIPGKSESVADNLKEMGFKVCATAVYTTGQVVSASEYGVDWIAVYYDRMMRNSLDPHSIIEFALKKHVKVLIASLKNTKQVNEVVRYYDVDVTLPVKVFKEFFKVEFPEKEFERFEEDFRL